MKQACQPTDQTVPSYYHHPKGKAATFPRLELSLARTEIHVFGKLSVSNISLPPYSRRIWHYDKADFVAIMRSIEMFKWREHLDKITCPNEQVKLLNEILLNIYSNFIPNQIKTIKPRQSPWITQSVRKFLRKKNHAYKNFVRNGRPANKVEGIQKMISEGAKMIDDAPQNYLRTTGQTLANSGASSKIYWL